jgi:adenylate cyclase
MEQIKLLRWYEKHYKDWWLIPLLALLLAAVTHLLVGLPLFRELETKTVDFRFRLCPQPEAADTNIVLIAVDQGSLEYIQKNLRQGWPFPREFYSVALNHLTACGASAVMFDINFDRPDFDRGDMDAQASDETFAAALAGSPQSVLSMTFEHQATASGADIGRHAVELIHPKNGEEWEGVSAPVPSFADGAGALGGINLVGDSDANVRKAPLYYRYRDKYYPSLAFAGFLAPKGKEAARPMAESLPLDKRGQLYLNWHGKGGPGGVFVYHPFSILLECSLAEMNGFDPPLPNDYWKGKYVIIGATATGLLDLKASPYTWGLPGMEVWATQLSNILSGKHMRFPAQGVVFAILVLVSLLVTLIVFRLRSGFSLPLVLALLALIIGSGLASFSLQRLALPMIGSVLALVITWLLTLTLSYVMEGRHKKELRMIFSRYLHPDLVNRIVENPDLVQMGGEELNVTVMFSDIYNFTNFSENKNPRELVSYLNEYFHSFTNSILDHSGQLDKYTGDGLMAVFGAPLARPDHALMACRAALAHRNYSDEFKAKQEPSAAELFHLNTRLGINSGTVVAGNIGSERRMEYTSIGDAVNLASRLESVNKLYRTRIIISQSTYEAVKDTMVCRELDTIRVKGKFSATRIFELIAEGGGTQSGEYDWIGTYQKALELYREGGFEEAAGIFGDLWKGPHADEASRTMKQRCEDFILHPPENWDGVFTLEEK